MTSFPLISICVPVYNVESWIEKCARSLFEQTYPNLEFVFVDDASTDNSMSILLGLLKEYPHLQARVVCMRNESNRGSAYTRKRTIISAMGDFIFCVDADDYIEMNAIQLLYSAIEKHGGSIAEGAFVHHQKGADVLYAAGKEVYDFYQVLRDETNNYTVPHLIRRDVLLKFDCFPPEGLNYLDDRYFMTCLRFFLHSQISVQEVLYHYVAHPCSVSNGKGNKHFRCHLLFYQSIELFLKHHNVYEQYADTLAAQKVFDKAALMLHCRDMKVRKQYADLYRDEEKAYFHLLHRSTKVVAWLVHNHYWAGLRLYQYYVDLREWSKTTAFLQISR